MRDGGANVARRVDETLGIVEEAGFFEGGLFGVSYKPTARTAGAVVICPAILSEYDHTDSIDVSLARALATRGIAVHRFHYRGSGHSDGEPSEMTFETMLEDALVASARFSREVGIEALVILGVRFGSLVAAAVANAAGGSPLVLWDPALNGRAYFREAWRADMMFQINEGAKPATRDAFPALLERDNQVDVLGYPIGKDKFYSEFLAARAKPWLGRLLDAPGSLIEVRTVEGSIHALRRISAQDTMVALTTDWLAGIHEHASRAA